MDYTSKNLVLWAESAYQNGWVFWYGTYGQKCTSSLLKQMKAAYPSKYPKKDFVTMSKQIISGKTCCDSIGLVKSFLWYNGTSIVYDRGTDMSSEKMYNSCKTRSTFLSRMPEEPGLLLFANDHTGIYVGNGYVIHLKSLESGIVKESIYEFDWFKWGYCPLIDYTMESNTEDPGEEDTRIALPDSSSIIGDIETSSSVYKRSTPPDDPTKDPVWLNISSEPYELLMWKFASVPSVQRTYDSTLTGSTIEFDNSLDLIRKVASIKISTVADQEGSGTPSWTNVRKISPAIQTGSSAQVNLSVVTDSGENTVSTYSFAAAESDMLGLSGAKDEKNDQGYETHRSKLVEFDGTENWEFPSSGQSSDTTLARFTLSVPDIDLGSVGICSHLPYQASPSPDMSVETVTGDPTLYQISVYILKSRMQNWSDAWTDTQKVDAFKALLSGQKDSETPVQVLYELAESVSYHSTQSDPDEFYSDVSGTVGSIKISSESSSVDVAYTGSGWSSVNTSTGLESKGETEATNAPTGDTTTTPTTEQYSETPGVKDQAYCPVNNTLTAIISNPNTVPDDLLPRVGDIVWVMFENGDISKPVCIGTLAPDNDTVQNVINNATYPSLGQETTDEDESPPDGTTDVTSSDLFAFAIKLVADNESSSTYDKIKWNNGGTSSIGLFQWKGDAARDLLIKIRKADTASFDGILQKHNAMSLLNTFQSSWVKYKIGSSESSNLFKAVKEILATTPSKTVQDSISRSNIEKYVKAGKSCDLTNTAALLYFCDIYHVNSSAAKEVAKKCKNTLDSIHSLSLKNSTLGKSSYKTRRTSVYKKIKEFLKIVDTPSSGENPSSGTTGTNTKKPVDYKQFDSRWGKMPYTITGSKDQTMASTGCSPTAVADILATWCDKSINPIVVAKAALQGGYRSREDGTKDSFFTYVAKSSRYKSYFSSLKPTGSLKTVVKALATGNCLTIAHVNDYLGHKGHYVLLWKADSSYVYVNDPGSSHDNAKRIPLSYMNSKGTKYFMFFKK